MNKPPGAEWVRGTSDEWTAPMWAPHHLQYPTTNN